LVKSVVFYYVVENLESVDTPIFVDASGVVVFCVILNLFFVGVSESLGFYHLIKLEMRITCSWIYRHPNFAWPVIEVKKPERLVSVCFFFVFN
jgi:hypothetical protein